ncbi:MAG TPA: methylmalonyl-CoA mutase family protein, partial [Thermoanaerobaculia bacterium]|nr:methylmalonyl-CoA mutase family protein [Thermoanaerobaculia bacterium]
PTALRLHARTAWRTKGLRDPGTDLVRSTLEALAAVLGGCDDLTCAPFLDPQLELALGLPLGSATQLLLREEAGFARLADPAGGSWYVESLTAALARRGWEMFAGIEEHGGMARALAIGAVARQVAEATERRRRALAEGSMPMVGVTMHRPPQPVPLPHRPLDAAGEPTREPPAAPPSIPQLAAEPGSPALFAAAVAAAAGGATLGALASALPPGDAPMRAPVLTAWRDAEPFETAAAAPEVPA